MQLITVFDKLLAQHGPQHWWPAESLFEVMVGAILTQNTAWSNVEKAIANLKRAGKLSARDIVATPQAELAELLTPSGYFNIKAQRLRQFCEWLLENGGYARLAQRETAQLRRELLSVHGIGHETADDILLYAYARPVFVIDAYTRRLFARLGLVAGDEPYEAVREFFEATLAGESPARDDDMTGLFNEYHALIVAHAKHVCRKNPACDRCCLRADCPSRQQSSAA
ncbi:MAG: endonuclease III-like protein [Gammaproteobacteria bacterium]|nr:MAG: endonuclease III-like protein [Gammaproteobacteria bacterium]TND06836.1 MAG: endonuclease III-like protein [Gammaproteobacteria bacterium]